MIFFRVLFVLLCIFGAEYAQPIDARDDIKIILELNGTIIADLDDPDAIKKLASVVQEEETQTENWKPKFKIHFAYILVIVTLTFLPIVFVFFKTITLISERFLYEQIHAYIVDRGDEQIV